MPDAENNVRTENKRIQNNQTVLSHERLHPCVTYQSSGLACSADEQIIHREAQGDNVLYTEAF